MRWRKARPCLMRYRAASSSSYERRVAAQELTVTAGIKPLDLAPLAVRPASAILLAQPPVNGWSLRGRPVQR